MRTRAGQGAQRAGLPARVTPPVIPEVVIGRLTGFAKDGAPLVDFPGNPQCKPQKALSTAPLGGATAAGRDVALLFADGNLAQPVVIGLIQQQVSEDIREVRDFSEAGAAMEAKIDDQRLVLTAENEIVLQCGKASITLTRTGKVLICGAYLSSRSTGVNRIKGGSVQVN